MYLIIYFLFLPTLLIPLINRLRNKLSCNYRGCLCVDVGGLYPSWSADMQKPMLGIWLFCRSGECKVASFAPDPNPIKASKKISYVIRAMMVSLQLHFPCSLAASIACSVLPVGSVIPSRKFCTLAHWETGVYWFKGFPVIAPAPDHYKTCVAVVEMLMGRAARGPKHPQCSQTSQWGPWHCII